MVKLLPDVVALIGVGLVSYGAWMAWPPAGFVVGGSALVAIAWTLLPGRRV